MKPPRMCDVMQVANTLCKRANLPKMYSGGDCSIGGRCLPVSTFEQDLKMLQAEQLVGKAYQLQVRWYVKVMTEKMFSISIIDPTGERKALREQLRGWLSLFGFRTNNRPQLCWENNVRCTFGLPVL